MMTPASRTMVFRRSNFERCFAKLEVITAVVGRVWILIIRSCCFALAFVIRITFAGFMCRGMRLTDRLRMMMLMTRVAAKEKVPLFGQSAALFLLRKMGRAATKRELYQFEITHYPQIKMGMSGLGKNLRDASRNGQVQAQILNGRGNTLLFSLVQSWKS